MYIVTVSEGSYENYRHSPVAPFSSLSKAVEYVTARCAEGRDNDERDIAIMTTVEGTTPSGRLWQGNTARPFVATESLKLLLAEETAEDLRTACGVTAPRQLWVMLGWIVYSNAEPGTIDRSSEMSAATEGDIIHARTHTGSRGAEALSWLIETRAGRRAEMTRSTTDKLVADAAVHAARIQRQAAELECRAKGIEVR